MKCSIDNIKLVDILFKLLYILLMFNLNDLLIILNVETNSFDVASKLFVLEL
jgi:hypothetical protein